MCNFLLFLLLVVITILCGVVYIISTKENLSVKERLVSFFVNNAIIKMLRKK